MTLVVATWVWGMFAFHWFWVTGLVVLTGVFVTLVARARVTSPWWLYRSGSWASTVARGGLLAFAAGWLLFLFMATTFAPRVRADEPCQSTAPSAVGRDCHAVRGSAECGHERDIVLLVLADVARPSIYRHCTWDLGY